MATLFKAAEELKSCLSAQAAAQKYISSDLMRLSQTDFNNRFWKVFAIHLPVCWLDFTPLIRTQ